MTNRIFVQIDLETLGLHMSAPIVSVGAAAYDYDRGIFDEFHMFFNLDEQFKDGRSMNQDTLFWWLKQSAEARASLADDTVLRESTLGVCNAFHRWWLGLAPTEAERKNIYPMGNASEFDLAMLRNLWGTQMPWSYKNVLCWRTIATLHKDELVWEGKGAAHNAVEDARAQARAHLRLMANNPRLR